MPSLPSTLALTTITGQISASPHNSNNSAVQVAVNALLGILDDGAAGQLLGGVGTALTWTYPAGYGAFSVTKSADQTGIVTATDTKVTFNTETLDSAGWFASDKYTPQVAGCYRLSAILTSGTAAGTYGDAVRVALEVWKNGSKLRDIHAIKNGAASDDWTLNGSTLVQANGSTDYFEIYFRHAAGVNRDLSSNCWFEGELVRAT